MVRFALILSAVLFAACNQQPKLKLLFIGDSITSQGGYVVELDRMLKNVAPGTFEVTSAGRNSETITGLTEEGHPGPRPFLFDRLDSLLDKHQPDFAFFWFGINCGAYQPLAADTRERYQNGLKRIVKSCHERDIHPVLITPPPLALKHQLLVTTNQSFSWKNPYPAYDQEVLEEFRRCVRAMTAQNVTVLDGTTELKLHLEKAYGIDPIHPTPLGHQLIAKSLFEQLTFLPL